MRKLIPSLILGSGVVVYMAACANDSGTPTGPGGTCTGSSFEIAPLTARVIAEADLACLSIPADGGTYL
ncbi:MAG: hypothetical protein ABI889_15095, partial [Gemmatimonadota bacterium]